MSASNSRSNYVPYGSNYYSTLADVAVDNIQTTCQSGYITLPTNFVIAPDNADSKAVIRSDFLP